MVRNQCPTARYLARPIKYWHWLNQGSRDGALPQQLNGIQSFSLALATSVSTLPIALLAFRLHRCVNSVHEEKLIDRGRGARLRANLATLNLGDCTTQHLIALSSRRLV